MNGLGLWGTEECTAFAEFGERECSEGGNGGCDFASEWIKLDEPGPFGEFPEDAIVGAGSIGAADGAANQLCEAIVVDDDAFAFDEGAGREHVCGVLEDGGGEEVLDDDGFDIAEGFGLQF